MIRQRRGRLTVIPYLVVAGMLTAAGIGLWHETRDSDGAASGRPTSYRVLYRTEERAGAAPVVTWEERVVDRPFLGRSVTFDDRPAAGDVPQRGTLTDDEDVFLYRSDGLHRIAGRVPGVGAGDQALDVVLDDAVDRGLARRLDERRIAGRSCRDYRLAQPPNRPLASFAGDDHDDVCIDGDGILLREAWTLRGRVVLLREAVDVDVTPDADDTARALSTDGAKPTAAGTPVPSVSPLEPGQRDVAPPEPPKGYHLAHAVRLAVPAGFTDPSAPAGGPDATSEAAWVFVHGTDVVTVEAGVGATPWSGDDAAGDSVTLGTLGEAQSVLGPDGSELRLDRGDAGWLRIRGTVRPDRLVAYARTLSVTGSR